MSTLPKSEWDLLLQSPMKLADGVGLRFDSKGRHCLHDSRTTRSWRLEMWQNALLREIVLGAEFSEAIREVIRHYPAEATRGAISDLIFGLRRLGFLKLERPPRSEEPALSARRWRRFRKPFFSLPLRWICQLGIGAALAVAGGWTLSQILAEPVEPLFPDLPTSSEVSENGPVRFAWEGSMDDKVAVRIWCHGVITDLLVRDGDEVKSGDVLARVADPMARATRDDLRVLLGECRMRRDRFYREGDPVAYLRETKAMARLTRELSEWEQQSDAVALRAPISGRVRRGWFAEAEGDRVSPGEVLMAIETVGDAEGAGDLLASHP
ncbi:MAG: biotin/lipoyl-binding protein [Verrucomicrobiae bacterium]|nr:biotin/lipoyl-binding protein [Verrucomicrobiae bacterium]